MYRVHLDNFDALERVQAELAESIKGTISEQVANLRNSYEQHGLPRHPKKAVERTLKGEMQGALLDGELGFVMPKPGKVEQEV